jgi:acetyltransferase-like isoleucine patch superfamily enzyme
VAIKKIFDLFCGRITPTLASDRSQMTRFRMQLLETLLPAGKFHKLTELFGTHYGSTSAFARAMGAKIGRRVYWPGTGPSIQSFDLLEIGDDVVFGSRSHLVTSDGAGSDYVRIKSGAMVADRVVLLPGSELGEKTVMGSGALAKRNKAYADGTTWVGNKKNEAVCLSVESTRPEKSGHRTEQYYESINAHNIVPRHSPASSTATTIVRPFPDSERSSMHLIEKPRPYSPAPSHYGDSDGFKSALETPADSRKPSIQAHRLDSFASSVMPPLRRSPLHKSEYTVEHTTTIQPESSSPFGRAFYEGKASYRVWGQFTIFCYSTLTAVLSATWWNAGSIAAVQVVGHMYQNKTWLAHPHGFLGRDNMMRPANLFIFFWVLIVAMMTFQSIVVLAFTIAAKWILMGRRMPGNYDWDKSSYCQRWQLFLKLETFRRRCYGNIGILGLLTGTHYVVLYFRALGAKIGSDCALFASGNPSLMFTEPDLLTLGDRVAVDDASLVGHINTRGKFDLNPLSVGSRSVLRTGSRLLSGARMEEDSCLLEHTLVMAGDVVDTQATVQGWPAEEFQSKRMPTMEVRRHWKPSGSA